MLADHYCGFRGFGLLVYGVLPSGLAALGVVRQPDLTPFSGQLLAALALFSLAPTTLLFLLVRQRLAAWYPLRDGLFVRSLCLTVTLLLISSAVVGLAGVIKNQYSVVWPGAWWTLESSLRWRPAIESLLIAEVASIGTSTLFLTAVKEGSGLPGLPAKREVASLGELRQALTAIQSQDIWHEKSKPPSAKLTESITAALRELETLFALQSVSRRDRTAFERLAEDLRDLRKASESVEKHKAKWKFFFDPEIPANIGRGDKLIRSAVTRIKEARF